jgi:simple sugar transport system permease protein
LSSVGAVAIALLVGAIVILISGDDPLVAYRALFRGAFGGVRPLSETLVAATPLIFGGLAFSLAFRAGMFNIGVEGQLVLGGLAAGWIGAQAFGLPKLLHLPLALVAAMLVGGLWGAIPGALKARTGAHEVITTIMLNYLAARISAYAVGTNGPLKGEAALPATDPAQLSAQLNRLVPGERVNVGLLLGLVCAGLLWYLLFRTTFGYRVRTVGLSRGAAAYAGISWGRTITLAMMGSGLLAGLGGASEVLGLQGRYYDKFSPGYGFTSIAIGLVGRNHPVGVVLAAVLFGALNSGATAMQSAAGTSKELVQILQALVILSVAAFAAVARLQIGQRIMSRRSPGSSGSQGGDRAAAVGMEPDLEARPAPPVV